MKCNLSNGETSRDFTYIDNVIQMNLLAGTTDNPEAFGEAFNVAVGGGRNTFNELYKLIQDELNKASEHHKLTTNNQQPATNLQGLSPRRHSLF